MEKFIEDFKAVWDEARQRTLDLLDLLTETDLERKMTRPGLDSISKHLQEMLAVDHCYVNAMLSGKIDFSGVPDVFSFDKHRNPSELKIDFSQARKKLEKTINSKRIVHEIDWFGDKISLLQLMMNMLAHEVFHQGQLTAHMFATQIPIPSSWTSSWALPSQKDSSK